MNSKEALELAILDSEKDLEFDENNQWVKNVLKGLKECQQDLEVLEILKKWIVVNETYDDLFPYEIKLRNGYVSNKSCLVFTKDDYEKVKEWLENE